MSNGTSVGLASNGIQEFRPRRILFAGDGWLGSNARSLADGFRIAGHDVICVDTSQVNRPQRWTRSWLHLKASGRRRPSEVGRVHAEIDAIASSWKPDVLVGFKTIHLDQSRLLELGIPLKVHYSADDVSNPVNVTHDYLAAEGEWDAVVTTKSFNVEEMRRRGVHNPLFVWSAYDPAWHHLTARQGERAYEVGFIGNARPDREALIIGLARIYGKNFRLDGPGWKRVRQLRATGAAVSSGKYGEEFSFAVASTTSNLVLLNSDNRDLHTCRSLEVPAAGGLFIGQRTAEHSQLLEEGVECGLFSSEEELLELLDRAVSDKGWARRLAEAGHSRITRSANAYSDRARQILAHVS